MSLQTYIDMLHKEFDNGTNNHLQHNDNPKYWELLVGDIQQNPEEFADKVALDFGCGKGRNVTNMLSLANFKRVDGVDISIDNINYCNNAYQFQNSDFYLNNGTDLQDLKSNEYDFVMSTIVFQHLCVHELRYALKQEICRVLKPGGIFNFQMGYGSMEWKGNNTVYPYYENHYDAMSSNSAHDVRIENVEDLISDLTKIGFNDIKYFIEKPFSNGGHPNWIYVQCKKASS